MLNHLERRGFLTSEMQQQGGRARKVYTITREGEEFLQVYYEALKNQIEHKDLN